MESGLTKITAYVRPHRIEMVKTAVAAVGVTGISISDGRGSGNTPDTAQLFGGAATVTAMPIRSRLVVACADELVEEVIAAIIENARTGEGGEPGDGKIFLERLSEVVRIRTGERGEVAV